MSPSRETRFGLDPRTPAPWSSAAAICAALLIGVVPGALASPAVSKDIGGTDFEPAAYFPIDEGAGRDVRDRSANHVDGTMVGNPVWVSTGGAKRSLLFDGQSRISVPSSPALDLNAEFTISAWVKGQGAIFRRVKEPTQALSQRAPYFQVVGDTIYWSSNTDHIRLMSDGKIDPNWRHLSGKERPFVTNLSIGTVDINLSGWTEFDLGAPRNALEPKLQVVGKDVYYEYFGQDDKGAYQIWTGRSKTDGNEFAVVPRTHQKEGYRTEQGNMHVVGNRIYYTWPERDKEDQWQTWLGSSARDGSGFRAFQITTNGASPILTQVAGDKIYFLLSRSWGNKKLPGKQLLETCDILRSDLSGEHREFLHAIEDIYDSPGTGTCEMQVSGNQIYLIYPQRSSNGSAQLFTATMGLDGTGWQAVERTLPADSHGFTGAAQYGVMVVGDRIHYALCHLETMETLEQARAAEKNEDRIGYAALSFWTAESSLDGSDWRVSRRTAFPPELWPNYKTIAVVGGKHYYALMEEVTYRQAKSDPYRTWLATSGSNIVNKGDAYGLGMTDDGRALAFVNGGQDYLYRAEAPTDPAGASVEAAVDDDWHLLAATLGGGELKFYSDGALISAVGNVRPASSNPFALTIGDGFVGLIRDIRIYRHTFGADDIKLWLSNPR